MRRLVVILTLIGVCVLTSCGSSETAKTSSSASAATVTTSGSTVTSDSSTTAVTVAAVAPSSTPQPSPTPSPTVAPAPTPTPTPTPKLTITSPKNGATTASKTLTVKGQAAPNAKVWIEIPDWPDASFHADASGNWQYQAKLVKSGTQTLTFHLDSDNQVKASVTFTYVPPTPTPTPVPKPTPTPTPTPVKPTLTPAQQEYLTVVQGEALILQPSLNRFSQLTIQAGTDPTLLVDPSWQSKVVKELGLWVATYNEDKGRKAPPGLEIINGKWIEMLGHLNLVANDFSKGVDDINNGDVDEGIALVNKATTEMKTANQNITELTPLIEHFISKHGG